MTGQKKVTLLTVLLLIGTYIAALFNLGIPTVYATDITEKVTITGFEIVKNGNQPVTEEDPINVSDTIAITYRWEIAAEHMQDITTNDTFTVSLPPEPYFHFPENGTVYELTNPSGGNPLGSFVIENGQIVVTLNEEGASQSILYNGTLSIQGWARQEGTEIDGGGNGSEAVPDLTVVQPEGGNENGPDEEQYKPENLPFDKQGKQTTGLNEIRWTFRTNYQGINDLIEAYYNDSTMAVKERGLIIDQLEPGMKFQPDSLYVTVPVFVATPGGNMGTRVVEGTANLQIQAEFVEVFPEAGDTIDAFQERVRNAPFQAPNKQAYGVYTDADGIDTVFIALGNLPDTFSYNDIHGGAVKQAILNDTTLTEQQKTDLIAIYCTPETSPGNGGIVAYDISFAVDVQVQDGYQSGTYSNMASFIWGEDGYEESEISVPFNKVGGDVEGEIVQAFKEVAGSGALSSPQYFEFELVDETAGNLIVAYGITETVVSEKGERVRVTFYKYKNDDVYSGAIVGNDGDAGWSNVLTHDHTYVIREVGGEDYEVAIAGGIGINGDRFVYNANVNKLWTFIIVNREPLRITAEKRVIGQGLLANSQEFQFELRDAEHQVVAYGKTTVNEKNMAFPIAFYTSSEYLETTYITNWKDILVHGASYTLVETKTNGYEVSYYTGYDSNGTPIVGNSFVANTAEGGNITLLVHNQDSYHFSAKKTVEGLGSLAGEQTFEFELRDITNGGEEIVAYGKAALSVMGEAAEIAFYQQADYDSSSQITDWASVLLEGHQYKLVETTAHHYVPVYTGGSGEEQNEFTVVYNTQTQLELAVMNKSTMMFEASKRVTGSAFFEETVFEFELIDVAENEVAAYGQARLAEKHTDAAIVFYPTADYSGEPITDWTTILTDGRTYQLKEHADKGYTVTYSNESGDETDRFQAAFNTGKVIHIQVTNHKDAGFLPETGGTGTQHQLIVGTVFMLAVLGGGIFIETRRKAGE